MCHSLRCQLATLGGANAPKMFFNAADKIETLIRMTDFRGSLQ